MKVWLVSCFVLFTLVQFVHWLSNFFIPLPLYILGGACLALASNYQGSLSNLWEQNIQNLKSSVEKNINE